jgi:hypothetical protein
MAPVAVMLLQAAAFVPLAIPAGVDVLYDLAGLQLNIHVLMSLSGACRASLCTYIRSPPLILLSSPPREGPADESRVARIGDLQN